MGLAGYYKQLSHGLLPYVTANLTDLTRKKQPNTVKYLDNDFKTQLTEEPVLKCPDENKPFIVQTDASECCIGAMLSQLDKKGVERPKPKEGMLCICGKGML